MNAAAAGAKQARSKPKFRAREQVTVMVLSACLSLGYVLASSSAAGLPLPTSGYWWFFGISAVVAVVMAWWGKWLDAGFHFMGKMADDGEVDDDEPRLRKDTPAQVLRTTWEFQTARASAVLYAIAMIVDLGWVTVFTGGSFYSPYAQLLLGCALLAPYVANGVRSGVLMGLTSLTSYAVFGYLFPFKELSENVPLHLVFLTTVLATLISLLTMNIRAIFRWIKEHVAQLEITEVDPAA